MRRVLYAALYLVVVITAVTASGGCSTFRDAVEQAWAEPTPWDPDVSQLPDSVQSAEVVWVSDGDTITVRVTQPGPVPEGDQRIRLLSIDSPETDEPCYSDATEHLAALIPPGTEVYLQADGELLDRYDRHLRFVWTRQHGLVNATMVEEGWAREFIWPDNQLHADMIYAAERHAQDAAKGIWSAACTPSDQ